jgi:hypothetical protein
MFCGNHEAAENTTTAIICSLLTSCKEQGVNPREWLIDVIGKMPFYQKPGNDENVKIVSVRKENSGIFKSAFKRFVLMLKELDLV